MTAEQALKRELDQFRQDFEKLQGYLTQQIIGQQETVECVLTALVAGGHVLIEGPPGVGKTALAHALTTAIDAVYRRIQFTPDLMPADIVGTYVVLESHGRRRFEFHQGPLFANILLADQINRGTPKTQSALLEGLEERAVTVANERYDLPKPFFVIATQTDDDADGVFPLPATQLDRFFFHVRVPFPNPDMLDKIADRMTNPQVDAGTALITGDRILEMSELVRQIAIAEDIRRYAVRLTMSTHPKSELATERTRRYVHRGASPRGLQALILAAKVRAVVGGRVHVAEDDLRDALLPALRHRLMLNFEGHSEGVDVDSLLSDVLETAQHA
jgi:MoxR-like ATPase